MSFTATGVRKRNLDTDRLQSLVNSDEQGFIQRMKPFNAEASSRGLVDTGQSGGQQPNDSADIFTTLGKGINGAIGYVQNTIEVATGDVIDFLLADDTNPFASYFKIVNAGVGKIIDVFNGGDFPGQILKLQGDDTDTVTLDNANDPGNTTSNIIFPGTDATVTLAVDQMMEFIYDPLKSINGFTGAWRFTGTDVVASSGTLPAGTAVNDHLEWNGAAPWATQQFLEFHTTGPFADSGFLRFPNDQIMLSERNMLDDGNLELKIDSSDAFDFTESNNAPVVLKWRAQHASAGDQVGTIEQFSNVTGEMVLRTPDGFSINIGGDPIATFAALAATGIEFFDFLDMSGNQVQDLTALVYTGFASDGKAITRFLSGSGGLNYDLENSGAEHVFRVNGNPPTEVMAVRDLGLLIAPAKILTFDVTSGSQGSINKTQASTMDFLCNDSFEFDTGNDATPIILYESGNDTDGLLAMNLSFNAESDVASTSREYANIKITIEDSANTLEDGSVRIAAMSNGVPDVGFYKANGLTVENEMFKPLRMATGDSLFVDTNFVDMNDLATPANPSAGTRRMFVDSGTGELSVRLSGGTTVSLEAAGGGSQTPWLTDIVAAGFDLNDLSNLEFRVTVSKPAASISAVYNEAGGLRLNAGVAEDIELSINDALVGTFTTTALEMNTLSITGINDLEFDDDATLPADTVTYLSKTSGSFQFNVPSGDNYLFKTDDGSRFIVAGSQNQSIGMLYSGDIDLAGNNLLNAAIMQSAAADVADNGTVRLGNAQTIQFRNSADNGNATFGYDGFDDFVFNFNALTGNANYLINAIDEVILRLRSDNNVAGLGTGFIIFEGDNVTPINHEYGRIVNVIRTTTAGGEEGSTQFGVHEGGSNVTYFEPRGDLNKTDFFRDIDMNANAVLFGDNVTPPDITVGAIYYENTTTGMNFNTTTGDDFTWRTNGAIQMTLDVINLDLSSMAGGGEIECNLYESAADGLVEISMSTSGISYSVNSGDVHTWTVIAGNNMTYNGNQLDLNTSKIVGTGDIDPDSNNLYDFGSDTLRYRICYLQEFTDTEEGFATGVSPTGTTDDAKVFCRPTAGGKTEYRVKFQTGTSIGIATEL